MKNNYLTAQMEIIVFNNEDIITASGGDDNTDKNDPSSDMSNNGWTGW